MAKKQDKEIPLPWDDPNQNKKSIPFPTLPGDEVKPISKSDFQKILLKAQRLQRIYMDMVSIDICILAKNAYSLTDDGSFCCIIPNGSFFFYQFWTADKNNGVFDELEKAVKEAAKK